MNSAASRRAMVDSQLRPEAVTNPAVIAAMASVPRETFLPEELRPFAYMDRTILLPGGRGMSPAASLGRLLTEIDPRVGERALVVGAGAGYSAALLAQMGLEVTAVESDPAFIALLRQAGGISVVEGQLEDGAASAAPFDVILVDGLVEELPDTLVAQLKVGGRLGTGLLQGGVPRLMAGTRSVHGFGLRNVADAPTAALPGFARPPVFTF